jgi:hypothetical protein
MSPRGLGALAASVVLVAACGGTKVAKVLDSQATGRQIADHLASTYGVAEPAVDCPAGVKVSARKTFDCSTVLEGQPLTVHVTLTDGQGHLTVSPASAVVVVAKIAAAIQSAQAVHCGPHTVVVARPGATFDCLATTAAGPVTYRVTVQDLAGHVQYRPVAAQTG